MPPNQSSRTIQLKHPFQLAGMDQPHDPGSFELITEQEQLDVVWDARRVTMTLLLTSRGRVESWPVTEAELQELLAKDRDPGAPAGPA